MEPKAPLDFYFDFISPFGYFASLRIDAIAAKHGRTVNWHPMLLGISVMKVMGLKPLLDTPLKGPYTSKDVRRYARLHGIGLGRPPDAPMMNPLPCGRAYAWAQRHHPEQAKPLAQALLNAYWVKGIDLSEPSSLAALASFTAPQAGQALNAPDIVMRLAPISGAGLVAAVQSAGAAQLLRDAVAASLAAGVFGSPTIIVDGEMFWGVDKLAQVELWLERGGW